MAVTLVISQQFGKLLVEPHDLALPPITLMAEPRATIFSFEIYRRFFRCWHRRGRKTPPGRSLREELLFSVIRVQDLEQVANVQLPLIHARLVSAGLLLALDHGELRLFELAAVTHIHVDAPEFDAAAQLITDQRFCSSVLIAAEVFFNLLPVSFISVKTGPANNRTNAIFHPTRIGSSMLFTFTFVVAPSSISIVKRCLA